MLTFRLILLVTHLLVFYKVSIVYTSILILLTLVVLLKLLTQVLVISTMLLVIRVLHLMMLVCSTAHMFHYRWFVQLERIVSNQKLALRLVTESLRTHLQMVKVKVWAYFRLTLTATTDVLLLRTSCKRDAYISQETPSGVSFFV